MTTRHFHSAILVLALAFPVYGNENLLSNPLFEEWTEGGQPLHWRRNSGTFTRSQESDKGRGSIHLEALDQRNQDGSIVQTVDIDGEQTLNLHARFKTEGSALVFATFGALDAEGSRIAVPRYYSTSVKARPVWSDLRWTFTSPPGTRKLNVFLRCRSVDGAPGSAWFDAVSLRCEEVRLGNRFVELRIDPRAGGGRIQSLRFKDDKDRELVHWERPFAPGGFGTEVLPADQYPGLLRDASYRVIERDGTGRRVLFSHSLPQPEYAGLRLDKQYLVPEDGCFVEVRLTLINTGNAELSPAIRVQQVLPAGPAAFTYPANEYVGLYDLTRGIQEGGVWDLPDMSAGWIACAAPEHGDGIVFLFDKEATEQAYRAPFCWFSSTGYRTVEWAYGQQTLAPGESWQTSYLIVPIASGAPVFSADSDIVAGLLPLEIPAVGDPWLHLTAYRRPQQWTLTVEATAPAGKRQLEHSFDNMPMVTERLQLPWTGERLMDIALVAASSSARHGAFLSEQSRFVKPQKGLDLPEPPRERIALADEVAAFFPYGGYLHGGHGGDSVERGGAQELWRRTLRLFRRNYLNTVTGHLQMGEGVLTAVQRTGSDWHAELLRKHGMRLIPRQQTFRFIQDGQPFFIENITRAQALEQWRKRHFGNIEWLRAYAEKYNDVILAYDISDEPEERFIPWYLHMRDIFREINPSRPAMPILQLYRLAYMPYVPVFYGDIYPIYSETHGGRDPWAAGRSTRRAVEEARGETPVWTMPQAFGSGRWQLPNEAETRYMAYAIFANGGKGLIYHGAVSSAARWLINTGYDRVYLSAPGTWSREWHVLGEVGQHLTAIGPATMDYLPDEHTGITIECDAIEQGKYKGPSILANVLTHRHEPAGFLLVVQNQDVTASRAGSLLVPPEKAAGRTLYNLMELRPVAAQGATSFEMHLEPPGGACILYLGSNTEAAPILEAVARQRYSNERHIVEIDLELAEANEMDAKAPRTALAEAEEAVHAGRYEQAFQAILDTQRALGALIADAQPLGSAKEAAEATRQTLSEVTEAYGRNIEIVTPAELVGTTPRAHRFPTGSGTRPQHIDALVERTAELIRRLNRAEDRLYLGQAREVVEELRQLDNDAEHHRRDVLERLAAPVRY